MRLVIVCETDRVHFWKQPIKLKTHKFMKVLTIIQRETVALQMLRVLSQWCIAKWFTMNALTLFNCSWKGDSFFGLKSSLQYSKFFNCCSLFGKFTLIQAFRFLIAMASKTAISWTYKIQNIYLNDFFVLWLNEVIFFNEILLE